MDKPLSQGQLSEDDLAELIDDMEFSLGVAIASPNGLRGITAEGAEAMLKALYELKRLQAIEIQQKKVIEFCTTNLTAYGLKSIANEAKKMLEGVNDHE